MASNQDTSVLQPAATRQAMDADEIGLYDRQIRLWGMQAQELIRNANVLLIGMKALGNEIAKNLVLAGIGGITIMDHQAVVEEDLGSQFLINEEYIGQNRAQAAGAELRKMNPRVNIITDTEDVAFKTPEYFAGFNIVITTGLMFEMASTINMTCRMYNVKFYAADVFGMYGYIFTDLIAHSYVIEKDQGNIPTKVNEAETNTRMIVGVQVKKEGKQIKEIVTKQEMYQPFMIANASSLPKSITKTRRTKLKVPPVLSCIRGLFEYQRLTNGRLPGPSQQELAMFTKVTNEKHLELELPGDTLTAAIFRSFLQNLGTEIPASAAYLGGQLAQDVINVLGQREQPLQNFMVFDGEEMKCPTYSLQPVFDASLGLPMNGLQNGELLQPVNGAMLNGNGFVQTSIDQAQTQGGGIAQTAPITSSIQGEANAPQ